MVCSLISQTQKIRTPTKYLAMIPFCKAAKSSESRPKSTRVSDTSVDARYQAVESFRHYLESVHVDKLVEAVKDDDHARFVTISQLTIQTLEQAIQCLKQLLPIHEPTFLSFINEISPLKLIGLDKHDISQPRAITPDPSTPKSNFRPADEESAEDARSEKARTPLLQSKTIGSSPASSRTSADVNGTILTECGTPSESSKLCESEKQHVQQAGQHAAPSIIDDGSTTTGDPNTSLKATLNGCSEEFYVASPIAADPRKTTIPILVGRLFFTIFPSKPEQQPGVYYFSTDDELQYTPFCEDFGPLNLGMTHSFCTMIKLLLTDPRLAHTRLVYYTSDARGDLSGPTNAVYLLGAFLVLHLKLTTSEAWGPFSRLSPPPCRPYRDATWNPSQHDLPVRDCWAALIRAVITGLYLHRTFDHREYLYYDDPSNGDIHEVVKGKFLALQGPLRIANYYEIFRAKGVTTVISLSKTEYDEAEVLRSGFDHHNLLCDDSGPPADEDVERFLRLTDAAGGGAVAVHSVSGLGAAGTLIAAYLIRRRGFAAAEAIAWVRICRPGSVVGAQQQYLLDYHARLAAPAGAAAAAAARGGGWDGTTSGGGSERTSLRSGGYGLGRRPVSPGPAQGPAGGGGAGRQGGGARSETSQRLGGREAGDDSDASERNLNSVSSRGLGAREQLRRGGSLRLSESATSRVPPAGFAQAGGGEMYYSPSAGRAVGAGQTAPARPSSAMGARSWSTALRYE